MKLFVTKVDGIVPNLYAYLAVIDGKQQEWEHVLKGFKHEFLTVNEALCLEFPEPTPDDLQLYATAFGYGAMRQFNRSNFVVPVVTAEAGRANFTPVPSEHYRLQKADASEAVMALLSELEEHGKLAATFVAC